MRAPLISELRAISESFRFELSDEDLESFQELIARRLGSYDVIDRMPEPALMPVRYPRTRGYSPTSSDNPHNAWCRRVTVAGADNGPLTGKSVAVKDNIALAGVPMANGSATLQGYVPDFDATVITRVLDAGATIVGKSTCEDMCFSGSSHTSFSGPVQNPRRPGYSAGGSSSGSAALLATGEVDLALGSDMGGSIRIPSSFCGIVGHKPTYGLVPYTGVFQIEFTLDHVGPMATNVADVAVLLEVLAGRDGLDPHQPFVVPTERYVDAVGNGLKDVKVAIVEEGFGCEDSTAIGGSVEAPLLSEPEVDESVRLAAERLAKAGASVSRISIPLHRDAVHIFNVIAMEGAVDLLLKGNGAGTNRKGFYSTAMITAYSQGLSDRAADLADTLKFGALVGEYVSRTYGGRHYAKGQNLAHTLAQAYDDALTRADVLVMPTTTIRPKPNPPATVSREEYLAHAFEMASNTCAFNVTGHPAISVPCHAADELPIGMMIVGRHFADAQVLRVAAAHELIHGGFS